MPATAQIAISAATLTAEEVAACFLRGFSFTDLAILVVPPGERYGQSVRNVVDARAKGARFVWQIDPECRVITVFPTGTHLEVFKATDELVAPELPLFRCRVCEFLQLLGVAPPTA